MNIDPTQSTSSAIDLDLKVRTEFPSRPYRGIDHFRFVDHPIFFARKTETIELLRSVVIFKGVILFGSSGTGKSSLINAGLLSRIIDMGFVPDNIRIQNQPGGEIVIKRISLHDDEQPPFLTPSLANTVPSNGSTSVVLSLEQFKEQLREYANQERALLIFDQFEEIITLFEETLHSQVSLKDALERQKQIIDALVGFLHDDTLPIKVLFAFREDYLAKLTKLFRLAPELPNQYLRLTLPQTKSLHDIIASPLQDKLQASYERKQTFSKELIDRLIEEFTLRSEDGAINLSEVQIVCLELWEASNPADLFNSRGIRGLLEDYLTRELKELSEEKRYRATGLLSHMLTSSNTRNFISGVELIRLFQNEEPVPTLDLKQALKALTSTRLVRRELRHADYFYEVASEFLVPWIIEQKTARQTSLERRRLEAENQREREEERKRAHQRVKYLRLGIALITLIMLLAAGLAVVMTQKQRQEKSLKDAALKAEADAIAQRDQKAKMISVLSRLFRAPPATPSLDERELNDIKNKLTLDKLDGITHINSKINENKFPVDEVPKLISPLLRDSNPEVAKAAQALLAQAAEVKAQQAAVQEKADQDKLDAINQMKGLMKEGNFPAELVFSLLGPTLTDKNSNSAIAIATRDLLTEASRVNTDLGKSIAEAVTNDPGIADRVPARVYIEIESQQQSEKAKSIRSVLENNGFIVPDFEVVDFRAPRGNEIRYYREVDRQGADQVVSLLKNLQLEVKTVYLKGYETSTKLRPGHYELWLAAQSKPGEDWYVVVNYSSAAARTKLVESIAPITEDEGGEVNMLSARELLIGPYRQDQARSVRQRLIDQDPNLTKKIVIIRR